MPEYDVRPGESLVLADVTVLVTDQHHRDQRERTLPIGVLGRTPTIFPAAAAQRWMENNRWAHELVEEDDRG